MNDQVVLNISLSRWFVWANRNEFYIVSPTSYSKMEPEDNGVLDKLPSRYVVFTDKLSYDSVMSAVPEGISRVIGIGGGTAIDYAKYVAKRLGVECVAIPSMLSTNVFATNKIAVVDSNGKHTEDGVLPDKIVIDYDYLRKSHQENLYGLVDVFSIFTALRDWSLAVACGKIPMNTTTYSRAEKLLGKSIGIANDIVQSGEVPDTELLEVIQQAGYITNDYGSGRPESGSEHIFASALEVIRPVPHALAVSLGIHIMSFFYNECLDVNQVGNHVDCVSIYDLPFNGLGIISDVNGLNLPYSLVESVVRGLKPRDDKFTIVDMVNAEEIDYKALREYLEGFGFEFKEGLYV